MLETLTSTLLGKLLVTAVIAMAPVVELRGAIPIGISMGLEYPAAFCAAVIGNLIPIPFIIVFIRRIFKFLQGKSKFLRSVVEKLESKAEKNAALVNKYELVGLCILVAIPLPGTGAWTGALVAGFLDLRLKTAFPAISIGVLLAGAIVTLISQGFFAIF